MQHYNLHPIGVAVNLTGLTEFVIRAWEKRYKAVTPERTSTNRRLYSDEDINKLKLLKMVTQNGYSIKNVAGLSLDELNGLLSEVPSSAGPVGHEGSFVLIEECEELFNEFIEGIRNFDSKKVDAVLTRASMELTIPVMIRGLIVPVLIQVGNSWNNGEFRVSHEHFATEILRTFLGNMVESFQVSETAPVIVLTTPSGQIHEFGALIAALYSVAEGWKAYYLGPNLPAEEIAATAIKVNAKVLFLSIIYPYDDPKLSSELTRLDKYISDKIDIIAGGSAVNAYSGILKSINAGIAHDEIEFKNLLRSSRNGKN